MSQPLIDIGVNLSNNRFKEDLNQVIERALACHIQQLVLTGTSVEETQKVIAICDALKEKYPGRIYATAGIHPHDADQITVKKSHNYQI